MNLGQPGILGRHVAGLAHRISFLRTSCIVLGAAAGPLCAQNCSIQRASLAANGQEIPIDSWNGSIAANGRFVTFRTAAALVAGDNNGVYDTYLTDTWNGSLELISQTPQGTSGNLPTSELASLSEDGRMVAFHSQATDLVAGLGPMTHAFVRDRSLGVTQLVSVSSSGIESDCVGPPRISGDGRFVAFVSLGGTLVPGDNNHAFDVFVRDLVGGTTSLVSVSTTGMPGNGDSGDNTGADISRDGRFVVFPARASNLVSGYTPHPASIDIYVRDRLLGVTRVVSKTFNGQLSNGISGAPTCSDDGQLIAFYSSATNLVAGDTNGMSDVFVRDMASASPELASISASAVQSNAYSYDPVISPDGQFVGFSSDATNLVSGDGNGVPDVFVRNRVSGQLDRVSIDVNGLDPNSWCRITSISRDAAELVFTSPASDLLPFPLDSNASADIFHRKCVLAATYCTAKLNSLTCQPTMSASGIPSATAATGFLLEARQVLNQKPGFLIYSTSGSNAAPLAGGTLCVLPPLRRTPGQSSGGSVAGHDCSGLYTFDFDAWIAGGSNPALIAGATVWAQYWSRDPGFFPPNNAGLTDAQTFLILP